MMRPRDVAAMDHGGFTVRDWTDTEGRLAETGNFFALNFINSFIVIYGTSLSWDRLLPSISQQGSIMYNSAARYWLLDV